MKKFFSLCLSLLMCVSLTIPTFAFDSTTCTDLVENISSEIDSTRFTVQYVEEIPADVVPLAFDNWEDAADWINGTLGKSTMFCTGNKTNFSTYQIIDSIFPDENYDFKGDAGMVMLQNLPKGSGSGTYPLEYDVPGLSAQTVTADHYFEYKNGAVTDWSVYADISGIGLATYSLTYEKLERHDVSGYNRYFGVCVGNMGYFLEVGGVPIGVYAVLELTYGMFAPK